MGIYLFAFVIFKIDLISYSTDKGTNIDEILNLQEVSVRVAKVYPHVPLKSSSDCFTGFLNVQIMKFLSEFTRKQI